MRLIALLLLLTASQSWGAEAIRIAVAANFRHTLEQINRPFQLETGYKVTLSSGSTGVLYSQISHGAPFDLFFAADRSSIDRLKASPRGESAGVPFCYARGALVLAGGNGELAQLANPALSLAIANPATAPYGVAAMEVLARAEFGPGSSRKLVRGTNVVQTYQFWHSGAVDLALLPRALAPTATPIPAEWYRDIEQYALALTASADKPALTAYLNWIRSDTVRTLITAAGYEPCP
jgi:molybdate transport system substrate-binding protein